MIWQAYTQRLTPERRQRMEKVASQRLQGVRLVLDDVQHPHNISACLRSAEAFGVQRVDVISQSQRFRRSTAGRGVQPWLELKSWDDRQALLTELRASDYLLCAAFPPDLDGAKSRELSDLPIDRPLALIFGNEQDGLEKIWQEACDLPFHIPMRGFVESLNISVAAAISLYVVTQKIIQSKGQLATLGEEQRDQLLRSWCRD